MLVLRSAPTSRETALIVHELRLLNAPGRRRTRRVALALLLEARPTPAASWLAPPGDARRFPVSRARSTGVNLSAAFCDARSTGMAAFVPPHLERGSPASAQRSMFWHVAVG